MNIIDSAVSVVTEDLRTAADLIVAAFVEEQHPRDEKGQWTSDGGFEHTGIVWKQPTDANGRPIPIKVSTVEEAASLVLEGKVVEVPDVKTAFTLINKLADMAIEAKAQGKEAKEFDLCNVSVSGTNMFCADKFHSPEYPQGVPRIRMPQLGGIPVPGSEADHLEHNAKGRVDGSDAFIAHLQGIGMRTTNEVVPAASLKASQREIIGTEVAWMMNAKKYDPAKKPLFISSDNYVVDGHHRWAATVGREAESGKLGNVTMRVRRINAPISEVLHLANAWSKKFGIKQQGGIKTAAFNVEERVQLAIALIGHSSAEVQVVLRAAGFDPGQARDEHGQWSSTGGFKVPPFKTQGARVSFGVGGTPESFEITTTSGAKQSGYLNNSDFPYDSFSPTRGELFYAEVPKSLQRKGIGTSLVTDALRLMHKNGAVTVNISPTSEGGRRLVESLKKNSLIEGPLRTSVTGKSEYKITIDESEKQRSLDEYKFASTQVNIPEPLRSEILAFDIRSADLVERELEPHITVKYGLHTTVGVAHLLQGIGPIRVVLGDVGCFREEPIAAGDIDGHAFHGNQWTNRGTVTTDEQGVKSHAGINENDWQTWADYGHQEINDALNGEDLVGRTSSDGQMISKQDAKDYLRIGQKIDKAANSQVVVNPSENNEFFRGEVHPSLAELRKAYPHNKVIETTKLTGVSADHAHAQNFAEQYHDLNPDSVKVMVHYYNKDGVKGVQPLYYGELSPEVVLAKGQNFRVRGINKLDNGYYRVNLQSKDQHPKDLPRITAGSDVKHPTHFKHLEGRWAVWDESKHHREHGKFVSDSTRDALFGHNQEPPLSKHVTKEEAVKVGAERAHREKRTLYVQETHAGKWEVRHTPEYGPRMKRGGIHLDPHGASFRWASDRYQAMGIPYPNPKTVCQGQCEGTGWIPVYLGEGDTDRSIYGPDEEDPELIQAWHEADVVSPTDDGWHFVKCPACAGSGVRGLMRRMLRLAQMGLTEADIRALVFDSLKTAGANDVVLINVISPDLERINQLLADNIAHTDTHPTYHPHVTLAYVKAGSGSYYEGLTQFAGKEFTVSEIVVCDTEGEETTVSLLPHTLRDVASEPRDQKGQWSASGSSSSRAERALATYKPSTRAKQLKAHASEKTIATVLGGKDLPDNEPMDILVKLKGQTHGIEVKTLIDNSNDKITCHPESRVRKQEWCRDNKAIGHTVIVDKRGSTPVYYHREGFGAFRLAGMERVNLKDLKSRIAGVK